MKTLFLFLLLNFFTGQLFATNYPVNSSTEIKSAMLIAVPGDTLIMAIGDWVDERIVFEGDGTVDNPIVLKAEVPGLVQLKGISTLRISGSYLVVDGLYFIDGYSNSGAVIEFRNGSSKLSNNCRLTNTAIVNYNPPSTSVNSKWISLYGKNNRVDHCYTSGKRHEGTTLVVWLNGDTNYHTIDNNYFGYRPELGVNGGETIRIGTSDYSLTDSYTLVENNYFERCNGEAEIISNKSGHNTFRYNTFFECEGALTLRHGKFAEVYNNYFLGNGKVNTGGVRIIDEGHKVYNNYFQDLKGSGYRSTITMMNGVLDPEIHLNRYAQVKMAEVVNNTIVNCASAFVIGAGSNDELVLPPTDCIIANNVATSTYQMIDYDDDPINMIYNSNIMYGGPLGIEQPDGIVMVDPELSESDDGLWRPSSTSPVINAGSSDYSYIFDDFDGQQRSDSIDIGGDEVSQLPVVRRPLTADDVGPSWYPLPEIPGKTIFVQAGLDSLLNAVAMAGVKDTIELVTDGGLYSNAKEINITKKVFIKSADGLTVQPELRQVNSSSSDRTIFAMLGKGDLRLKGVRLNGMSGTDTPAKYLIRSSQEETTDSYKLKIEECSFFDVSIDGNGNFFRAYAGTFADTILISNSLFTNSGKEGIRLKDEETNSSKYNVEYFEVSNSTFWNIPNEAIYIYAGDEVVFTPGPKVVIDHSTFDNCGYSGKRIVYPLDCDGVVITNSIFSNGDSNSYSVSLYGFYANYEYNNIFNAGEVELAGNIKLGAGVVDYDPLYSDVSNGDFTLPSNSPILNKAKDGSTLGDSRWATNPRSYFTIDEVIFGDGTISYSPESISKDYDPNTLVTLTAYPAEGFEFYEWSGDINSFDSVTQVNMDSDKNIIATFTKIVSVKNEIEIPNEFALKQNYPNPFNPSTVIEYSIPKESKVQIDIFNVQGELIKTLVNNYQHAGVYKISWSPNNLSSGLYILRMRADAFSSSRKIIFMK